MSIPSAVLASTPLIPPPPGITSNFVDPQSRSNAIIDITIVFTIFAGVVVLIRAYTKFFLVRHFGADDYFVIAGLLTALPLNIGTIIQAQHGAGRHGWDVSLAQFQVYLRSVIAAQVCYCFSISLIKISILFFFLRFTLNTKFRAFIFLVMFVCAGYGIGSACSNLFACHPMNKVWDITVQGGYCIDRDAFYIANGAINIGTDCVMILIPIPIVWNLQMPTRQKIVIALIFMTGSLVVIISIIRLASIFPYVVSKDLTWDTYGISIWCVVELNLAMVAACAPSLKPFFHRYLPWLLRSSKRDSSYPSRTPHDGDIHSSSAKKPKLKSPGSMTNDSLDMDHLVSPV